jgi:hypothetical protein
VDFLVILIIAGIVWVLWGPLWAIASVMLVFALVAVGGDLGKALADRHIIP